MQQGGMLLLGIGCLLLALVVSLWVQARGMTLPAEWPVWIVAVGLAIAGIVIIARNREHD